MQLYSKNSFLSLVSIQELLRILHLPAEQFGGVILRLHRTSYGILSRPRHQIRGPRVCNRSALRNLRLLLLLRLCGRCHRLVRRQRSC
jgi:hypothetical protein